MVCVASSRKKGRKRLLTTLLRARCPEREMRERACSSCRLACRGVKALRTKTSERRGLLQCTNVRQCVGGRDKAQRQRRTDKGGLSYSYHLPTPRKRRHCTVHSTSTFQASNTVQASCRAHNARAQHRKKGRMGSNPESWDQSQVSRKCMLLPPPPAQRATPSRRLRPRDPPLQTE